MILYIIVPLAVLLLFLLAFMLVRTATFMETPPPPEPAASLAVEVRPVAEHLSEVIRVETEDRGPGEPPAPVSLHDHVLGNFTSAEEADLPAALDRAAEAIRFILKNGLAAAMNEFNKEPL